MRKHRILVTNDDGVYAPGIKALADALREIGDVVVVAPDRNRSGASHSLTLSRPVSIIQLEENRYAVEGTPTDCSHLALTGLFSEDDRPDIVVSGINAGANLGDDVLYSGTVGAALEGRFIGITSVAVSLVEDNTHYETAAHVAKTVVADLLKNTFSQVACLNINVPNVPIEELAGYEVTRLGSRHAAEPAIKQVDPRGKDIYWIGPAGKQKDVTQGTDFDAIAHNKVSITPLNIDLTDYRAFDHVVHWLSSCEM